MKILYIITARGGSKGVPKKNLRELAGIPLIAYKIISAKRCKYRGRIIVSTDDEEIASVSKSYRAEVPFMRPKELATDQANSMDVVKHAMNWIEKQEGKVYDYICLLEPSSPFGTFIHLEEAITKIIIEQKDTLLGMKEAEINTCFIHELDAQGGLSHFYQTAKNMKSVRRQEQAQQYTMNGCMYIAKWDYFQQNETFHAVNSIPYVMPSEYSIEIDSMADLQYAQYLIEQGVIQLSYWIDEEKKDDKE